ncbi:hypothetical protein QQF64_013507 [Cirrhinus molitorella]|uniref:Uncharacterized protein n=1 Tax=Cirrhinus molitorella TaxID=172907 RepID=A0ABR3LTZ2_9TELE
MDLEDKISLFLMQYRTTPNCTTGQSPADVFLNRHVRTRLDFIYPDITVAVRRKQYLQKFYHDQRAVDRSFSEKDAVYLRNTTGKGSKWVPGVIVKQTGLVSYNVQGQDADVTFRRHGDQLRPRVVEDDPVKQMECLGPETPNETCASVEKNQGVSETSQKDSNGDTGVAPGLRRSSRIRKPPKRYDL